MPRQVPSSPNGPATFSFPSAYKRRILAMCPSWILAAVTESCVRFSPFSNITNQYCRIVFSNAGFALVGFNLFWAKLEKPAIKKQPVKKIIRFMLICFSEQKFTIEKYNNFLLQQANGLYLQRF